MWLANLYISTLCFYAGVDFVCYDVVADQGFAVYIYDLNRIIIKSMLDNFHMKCLVFGFRTNLGLRGSTPSTCIHQCHGEKIFVCERAWVLHIDKVSSFPTQDYNDSTRSVCLYMELSHAGKWLIPLCVNFVVNCLFHIVLLSMDTNKDLSTSNRHYIVKQIDLFLSWHIYLFVRPMIL